MADCTQSPEGGNSARAELVRIRHKGNEQVHITVSVQGRELTVRTEASRLDSILRCRRSILASTGLWLRLPEVEDTKTSREARIAWLDIVERALERGLASE